MNLAERAALMLSGLVLSFALSPAMADPPALVGRIAVAEGEVRLIPEQGAEPIASPYNFPVVADARLHNGFNGRTAIQVGHVSLWLGEDSELGFSQLDEDILDLDLAFGVLAARVVEAPPEHRGPVLVSTLPAQVSLLAAGRYRVQSDTVETRVMVSEGLAWVSAGKDVAYVSAGQALVATTGGVVSHGTADTATEGDAFAHWVATHDIPLTGETVRHVSPAMTGWQDLDAHGSWQETVEYGPLWIPARVSYDWAPYRHGEWVWLNPWGWTWVDRAPWGFAPFHYGRWVHYSGRWCWSPGRLVHRPVFAPALVVFTSSEGKPFRPHRHRPPSKWAPLGPRDRFEPHFDASPRFKERVNATHFGRHHVHDARRPGERTPRDRDEVRRRGRGEADSSARGDRFMNRHWETRREVHPDFQPRRQSPTPGFSADTETVRPPAVQRREGWAHPRRDGVRPDEPRRDVQRLWRERMEQEEMPRRHFGDSGRPGFGDRQGEAVPRHRRHAPDDVNRADGSFSEPGPRRDFRGERRPRGERDVQVGRETKVEPPTARPREPGSFAPPSFGQRSPNELRRGRAPLAEPAIQTAPARAMPDTQEGRRPFRDDGGFDRGGRPEGRSFQSGGAAQRPAVERRGGVWPGEARGALPRGEAGRAHSRGFPAGGTR